MRNTLLSTIASFGIASAVAIPARAQAPEVNEKEPDALGLHAELGLHSAYVWRGLNLFADTDVEGRLDQSDQNLMLAPSLAYMLPGTNLSVGYWGAFQLTGDHRGALVDAGVGAEQDLFAFWELSLDASTSLELGATYYFYPFAEEEQAGVDFPHMLEPTIIASHSLDWVDVGLTVAYFHAFTSELEAGRHVYINPAVERETALTSAMGLGLSAGFGYKIWTGDHGDDDSNTYDVLVGVAAPVALGSSLSVSPGVSWAWTNFEGRGFGDEHVVFGSLVVGAEG
ncbi:MAG: hypothetical protein ACOC1F_11220 [Myxococcota bacterium]